MFESFCVLLLRLYPADFRRVYGDEAEQLLRIRARHEQGVFLRARLLMDLALDLGATTLHAWRGGTPFPARIADGPPSFDSIDVHGPGLEALAVGVLTSVLVFAAFPLLLQADSNRFAQRIIAADSAASRQPLPGVAQPRPQAFAAISIAPSRSGDASSMRLRVLPNGDLSATAVPVLLLLRYAYDVPLNASPRLSGLPAWRERYDIEAKAPARAIPLNLPESERRSRLQGMVRGLLADRFKLAMRIEQKTMPVYALTVASEGSNMRRSAIKEKDCVFDTASAESCHNFVMGRGHPLTANAVSMDDLAQYLENWTDLPVVNRTSLSGLFAMETEGWIPCVCRRLRRARRPRRARASTTFPPSTTCCASSVSS